MNFLQLFNISLVSESARSDFVDNQIIRLRAEQSSVSMELRLLRADLLQLSSFTLKYHDSIYLFYSAYSKTGRRAIGIATSSDGYLFTKFQGNPILEGDIYLFNERQI